MHDTFIDDRDKKERERQGKDDISMFPSVLRQECDALPLAFTQHVLFSIKSFLSLGFFSNSQTNLIDIQSWLITHSPKGLPQEVFL